MLMEVFVVHWPTIWHMLLLGDTGAQVPAAFRGIASRIVPIPMDGLGIPPPLFPELCGVRVLSRPTVVPLRRDSDPLFQPDMDRRRPALVTFGGSGGMLLLRYIFFVRFWDARGEEG